MLKDVLLEIQKIYPEELVACELLQAVEKYEAKVSKQLQKKIKENAPLCDIYQILADSEAKLHKEFSSMMNQKMVLWSGRCTVDIDYINAKKEQSHRTITVLQLYVTPLGKLYVNAWCHLREEERSFVLDNIQSAEINGHKCTTSQEFIDILTSE